MWVNPASSLKLPVHDTLGGGYTNWVAATKKVNYRNGWLLQ